MAAESTQTQDPNPRSAAVQTPTASDIDPEGTDFVRLQGQWEKHMRNISPKKRHLKVEVLLLYWEKKNGSYLDTEKEVNDLEEVFGKDYNYNVHRGVLNDKDHPNPTLWINRMLATFVEEHDSDNSLLIIYYAGHGIADKAGGLSLKGGNPSTKSQKTRVDEIAWSKTQGIIDSAQRADFLLIFDCCFAGKLAGLSSRKDFSKTNFDFLGASGPNELAEVPGDRSFTFAMTRALRKFASDTEGFTTSELFIEILKCPTFPKDEQTPCMISEKNCVERLLLAPLPKTDGQATVTPSHSESEQMPTPLYCLRLDFLLPNLPSDDEMADMCDGFKHLIHEKKLIAQKIVWNALHRNEMVPPVARAIAHKWMSETYMKKSRHTSSEFHKRPSGSTKESMADFSPLERTESPLEHFAQNSEIDNERVKRQKT